MEVRFTIATSVCDPVTYDGMLVYCLYITVNLHSSEQWKSKK